MAGIIVVNDSGTWKSPNFHGNTVWIKDTADSTWKEPVAVFTKVPSTGWTQVWPSDSESTTTANLPTNTSRVTNSSYVPNLSSNPSYPHTNLTSAASEVRWDDRTGPTSLGEYVSALDFNWTVADELGFGFGVVTDVEVSFKANKVSSYVGSTFNMRTWLSMGNSTGYKTSALNTSSTLYTHKGNLSYWGVTGNEGADELHDYTGRSTTGRVHFVGVYDNVSAGADQEVALEDVSVKLYYATN